MNARLWTRRLAARNEVVPGIWLGQLPRVGEWQAGGEPALVSLCAELTLPHAIGLRGRCLPWPDLVVPRVNCLRRAANLIERQRRLHPTGRVWVCCALGFSRSAAAVEAWLLLHHGSPTLAHADALTHRARPQIVLRPEWQQVLRTLKKNTDNGNSA